MQVEITGIQSTISQKTNTPIVMMFFRGDQASFHTYLDPQNRNYARWKPFVERVKRKDGPIFLDGLQLKGGRLVDADSPIREIPPPTP